MAASMNPYPACGSVHTAATGEDESAATALMGVSRGEKNEAPRARATTTRLTVSRLLANGAARDLDDDVKVSEVTGVLLKEVEKNSLQGRLHSVFPTRSRLAEGL